MSDYSLSTATKKNSTGPGQKLETINGIGHGEFLVMCCILYTFLVTMLVLIRYDSSWTLWLNQHKWHDLTKFMGRTAFEGDSWGGGDFGTSLFVLATILYFVSWLVPKRFLRDGWRPYWGFILTACLSTGIFMVHSLKWVVGRARPSDVMEGAATYTEWFEMGSYFIAEGTYRGSLPSGHTSTVFFLMTITYILTGNRYNQIFVRLIGLFWGATTFLYCLCMAVSRSMALCHWIGDCLLSIWLGWVIIHIVYFWVLRIPLQIQYHRLNGTHPQTPYLWEFRLCLLLLLLTLGCVAMAFGIRSIFLSSLPWISMLVLPGYITIGISIRRIRGLLKKVYSTYEVPSRSQQLFRKTFFGAEISPKRLISVFQLKS